MKIVFTAFILLAAAGGDIFQQVSISKSDVAGEIVSAFGNGNVAYHRVADVMRKASPAARAAMVEQVLVWTKAHVASPQFAKDYAAFREQQKPASPDAAGSIDDELKRRRAQQAAELEESRKALASMPAEYRKQAEEALKEAAAALKALDTPEQRSMEREQLEEERRQQKADYDNALREWNTKYPATPSALIKHRIREFLDATAGVDYDAKLVQSGSRKRFANPEYEARPAEWKLAFRAGRETTEKARAFAQMWLQELR